MENNHNFKLVDGKFDPAEAREILFSLINSKINYHNSKAFSIKERFNGDTSNINKRVEALKKTCEDLREVLNYADKNRMELIINGIINIEMIQKT